MCARLVHQGQHKCEHYVAVEGLAHKGGGDGLGGGGGRRYGHTRSSNTTLDRAAYQWRRVLVDQHRRGLAQGDAHHTCASHVGAGIWHPYIRVPLLVDLHRSEREGEETSVSSRTHTLHATAPVAGVGRTWTCRGARRHCTDTSSCPRGLPQSPQRRCPHMSSQGSRSSPRSAQGDGWEER